jgi:indolepyruvate ferredoxin oxidoreductase
MNAPLTDSALRALQSVQLDDKYRLEHGRAFMSGVQALVKLPMLQRQRDAFMGKNTAGFISGYRGSPLGTYDQSLWKAKAHLQAQNIVFQPGVNEELAATALWGTQQLGFAPPGSNTFDGVFGIWYGKGPGVDRCADVFKHANLAGTTAWGGVLAVAGDDHVAKSSTAAHQSDHIFKACGLPVFFPSSVQEILDHGLHAIALSRYAGVWAGMKTIQEIVESSSSVTIDPERVQIARPSDFAMPAGGVHIRWPDTALEQEQRLFDYKWYAALAYIRANGLNRTVIRGEQDRLGIIASGKAYNDLRQALVDLGLDEATCQRVGVRVHKVGVVWPLEPQSTREFATGLREILVVEEKRQVIEYQLKEELYNWRSDVRPDVLGKFDEVGADHSGGEWSMPNPSANTLLRANADLSPAQVAKAVASRLMRLGVPDDVRQRMAQHLAVLSAKEQALQSRTSVAERMPWFCSGCPHNTSTRVPEGSRAMAGIGCHFMALWMDRSTTGFTQMGGEGVPWVGQQPFTNEKHIFANLGDGTYFHSGILAIRQSIVAGVNITYKLLYNDAVAMTGGQPVGERAEGLSTLQIAHALVAEGVKKLCVVTDEPEKYVIDLLPPGVQVRHRDELDAVQREFRDIAGCTVIVYDQTCATEKRRRRKRGTMADPAVRVFINEAVCEGCGDCGEQSNCVSIEPLDTPLGRKRTINQSTCNKDLSCVKGFCPSFVTVHGGQLKKPKVVEKTAEHSDLAGMVAALPEPAPCAAGVSYGIVVAGVGGTGVITIGQVLGMAAHIEGKGIVTQDAAGLAQKGGATWSHVLISDSGEGGTGGVQTTRVGMAGADLVIACDPVVAASKETVLRMRLGKTRVALNSHMQPTAAFLKNANWASPDQDCTEALTQAVGDGALRAFDAQACAVQLLGDSIYANPMLLGFAWQQGFIPLSQRSLRRAIELNDVAVVKNLAAFDWGRVAASQPDTVAALLGSGQSAQPIHFHKALQLDDAIALRVAHLTAYQNAAYAQRYSRFVAHVREVESAIGKTSLTQIVAKELFRLMAYKDEYEVARLHTQTGFLEKIAQQYEGDYSVSHHLAPPLLAKKNAQGQLQKSRYGAWVRPVLALLASLKVLRGTPLDVFGLSHERRMERALIAQYQGLIEAQLQTLSVQTHAKALQMAQVAELIKGFGHVKAANVAAAQKKWLSLQAA